MRGVGKGSKAGRDERDQRNITDLRGCRFELRSQLPSCVRLEKTVSGRCGMLSMYFLCRREAFILQLPGALTANSSQRLSFWGCPPWAQLTASD